jgi:hypothetical protein
MTLDDLPAPAVRLITRYARTRRIPGTNRFARICRSWRDAALDSDSQEQLQLLLALEGLPADTLATTSSWLAQHGGCVTSLHVTYDPETAPLFQQLPLSSAPLVNLARLEVDGPDSLVALAPALPQLVALTHLRASIGLIATDSSTQDGPDCVFSVRGQPLEAPPCLQQLCPGLKSLHLGIRSGTCFDHAPVAQLLPDGLEQLRIDAACGVIVHSAALTPFTSLRRLTLYGGYLADPDLLLVMPGLEEVDLRQANIWSGPSVFPATWLERGLCPVPQHLTKLTGLRIVSEPGQAYPPSLQTALCGLRKLQLYLVWSGPTVCVQQLSSLTRLQHLWLELEAEAVFDAEPALSALSGIRQLTCLCLSIGQLLPPPRSTWAAVLPHLPQLRVLAVRKELLLEGALVAGVARLTGLQCLYVEAPVAGWDPAATGAEVAPHLHVLSKCSSLKAVLCWGHHDEWSVHAPPLYEYVHQGRLHLSCWHKWRHAAEEGRVVCPRPCPHLPGVWEPQQQEAADGVSCD